jgi:hypothetical protein
MSKKRSSEDDISGTVQEFTKMQLFMHLVDSGSEFTLVQGDAQSNCWYSLMWGHKTNPTNIAYFEATINVDGFVIRCRFPLRIHNEEWKCTGLGFKLRLNDESDTVFRIVDSKDTTLSNDCRKQHEITIIEISPDEATDSPFVIKRRSVMQSSLEMAIKEGNNVDVSNVRDVDDPVSMIMSDRQFQWTVQDNIMGSFVSQLIQDPRFRCMVIDAAVEQLTTDHDFRVEVERRAYEEIKDELRFKQASNEMSIEQREKRANIEALISKAKKRKLVIPKITLN